MDLYCAKRLMFPKKKGNIKIYREIDGKINFYSCYVDCGFQNCESIDEEKLKYL